MSRRAVSARAVADGGHRLPVAAIGALVLLLVGLSIGVGASPAEAHAALVSSSPENGAEVDVAPTAVEFTFDQTVRIADDATQVVGDDGARVDLTPRLTDGGKTVEVPLRSGIGDGAYTASYRVVSEDGHVVAGAIRFGIGVAPAIPDTAAATPADPLTVAQEAAQGAVYLGVVLLLGIGLVSATIWRGVESLRRIRVLRLVGWVLLITGTLARLALTGPIAAGTGIAGLIALTGIGVTLTGVGGLAEAVRVGLLVALLPFALRPGRAGRGGRAAAAAIAVLVLVTIALDGHAVEGADAALAVTATTVHLAAMAVWAGGIAVLLAALLPRSGRSLIAPGRLRRWSMLAFAALVALVVTGEYQAWRQLDPLDSLVATDYGILLLVKLGLVAVAAGAGLVVHRLVGHAGHGAGSASRLRRGVLVEAGAMLAVVIVTTALAAAPPARTSYGPAVMLSAPAGDGMVTISIDTTHVGVERFELEVRGADGLAAAATSISGEILGAGSARVPLDVEQAEDGTWHAAAVVPTAGEWTVQLDVDLGAQGDFSTSASYRAW